MTYYIIESQHKSHLTQCIQTGSASINGLTFRFKDGRAVCDHAEEHHLGRFAGAKGYVFKFSDGTHKGNSEDYKATTMNPNAGSTLEERLRAGTLTDDDLKLIGNHFAQSLPVTASPAPAGPTQTPAPSQTKAPEPTQSSTEPTSEPTGDEDHTQLQQALDSLTGLKQSELRAKAEELGLTWKAIQSNDELSLAIAQKMVSLKNQSTNQQ